MAYLRVAKGLGVASCLALAGMWTVSLFFYAGFYLRQVRLSAGFADGVADIGWGSPPGTVVNEIPSFSEFGRIRSHNARYGFVLPRYGQGWGDHGILVPFWMLLSCALIPTVWLWRRAGAPGPGSCACGYDLTGNVSGVCPECGERIVNSG